MSSFNEIDVRDNYQLLGRAYILHASHVSSHWHYRIHGYMCKYGLIPLDRIREGNLSYMKKAFMRSNAKMEVFNLSSVEERTKDDNKRLQIITKDREARDYASFSADNRALLDFCETAILQEASQLLATTTEELEIIESVLMSKAKLTEPQEPHRDLDTVFSESACLALVCLEPNTTILLARKTNIASRVPTRHFISRYGLSVGDVLFFHPRLIHAGDSYTKSNLRLHYYVLPKGCVWNSNTTYFLSPEERAAITFQPAEIVNEQNINKGKRKRPQNRNLLRGPPR